MTDPFSSILIGAAGNVTAGLISSSIGEVGAWLKGDAEREAALNRATQTGLAALLVKAKGQAPDLSDHVETAFQLPLRHPDLMADLGKLLQVALRGREFDSETGARLFREYQFDLADLPGLDLQECLRELEAAFIETADRQEVLQTELLTFHARRHSQLLEEAVALLRRIGTAPAGLAGAADAETTRQLYLQQLARHCQALPLAELGGKGQGLTKVRLGDVFIELNTQTRIPRTPEEKKVFEEEHGYPSDDRLLTAEQAADRHPQLVLLGHPGSGKSSFIRHLVARLAAPGPAAPAPPWAEGLLPVLLVLRHLAPLLARLELDSLDLEQRRQRLGEALQAAVVESARLCGAEAFGERLREALISGRCLLVLDGLDEVPAKLRPIVRRAVEAALQTYSLARVIVTCRVHSYQGRAQLPDFTVHELMPLTSGQVERFVEVWYHARHLHGYVTAAEAEERAEDLKRGARGLLQLADNPMLLTTMALVHQQNIRLPPQKVCLYHEAVKVLLVRWQESKGLIRELAPRLVEILNEDGRIRPVLERLAFEIHRREQEVGESEESGLEWERMLKILKAPVYLGSTSLAEAFLEYVDQQAGILVGRGGGPDDALRYSFPHRTFQEYLAGCYLVSQSEPVTEIYQQAAAGDFWYLPVQLAAEELLHNRRVPQFLLRIAVGLFPVGGKRDQPARRASLWAAWMAALLEAQPGGVTSSGPESWKSFLARCRKRLVSLLGKGLPVRERVEAGRLLAKLGDPRPEVMTVDGMEFCRVPAGPFWMGSEEQPSVAYHKETPITRQEVDYDFWMARYPVTQAQFRRFVDAGGYREAQLWAEAQAAEYWTAEAGFKGRLGPVLKGEPFDLPNHPAVGVSWFEALAFTRWLTARAWDEGWLPSGWRVALPSELEWEKAARGGEQVPVSVVRARLEVVREGLGRLDGELVENPEPRRVYPWGGDFDADTVNSHGRLGGTSTPGVFPQGASPVGCEELSGTVWEWTRSSLGEYPYPADPEGRRDIENISNVSKSRVVRGGSWNDSLTYVRCACRFGWRPGVQDFNCGFRVVLLPSTLNSVFSEL